VYPCKETKENQTVNEMRSHEQVYTCSFF